MFLDVLERILKVLQSNFFVYHFFMERGQSWGHCLVCCLRKAIWTWDAEGLQGEGVWTFNRQVCIEPILCTERRVENCTKIHKNCSRRPVRRGQLSLSAEIPFFCFARTCHSALTSSLPGTMLSTLGYSFLALTGMILALDEARVKWALGTKWTWIIHYEDELSLCEHFNPTAWKMDSI